MATLTYIATCLHVCALCAIAGTKEWTIIVGQGKHSLGGQLVLKAEVLSWLTRMQLQYDTSMLGAVSVTMHV